jgi:hypothetical protein
VSAQRGIAPARHDARQRRHGQDRHDRAQRDRRGYLHDGVIVHVPIVEHQLHADEPTITPTVAAQPAAETFSIGLSWRIATTRYPAGHQPR